MTAGRNVAIAGLGTFFPARVRRSAEFDCRAAGVGEEWLAECGIDERRWAAPDETIIDLAHRACTQALAEAGLDARDLDRLFLVSSTLQPDLVVPSGAGRLLQRLGIERGQAFFMLETCCGALMAMDLAAASIRAGHARHVLVVAAETFSKVFNPTSPFTFKIGMSMGDGAGAVVLAASDGPDALLASCLATTGDFESGLGMRPDVLERDGERSARICFGFGSAPPRLRGQPMPPKEAFHELQRFTTRTVPEAIEAALRQAGLEREAIDFFILHQPNRQFLEGWRREARVPPDRTLDTLRTLGNLSSVSVLANLDAAVRGGRVRSGATVLLAAVGEGTSWGAMVWKWGLPTQVGTKRSS